PARLHRPDLHPSAGVGIAASDRSSSLVAGAAPHHRLARLCRLEHGPRAESSPKLAAAPPARRSQFRLLDGRLLWQHHRLAGTAISTLFRRPLLTTLRT